MKNRIELGKLRNEKNIFLIVLLVILYAMDFLVLANIIVASAIITKVINYIIEKVGM